MNFLIFRNFSRIFIFFIFSGFMLNFDLYLKIKKIGFYIRVYMADDRASTYMATCAHH